MISIVCAQLATWCCRNALALLCICSFIRTNKREPEAYYFQTICHAAGAEQQVLESKLEFALALSGVVGCGHSGFDSPWEIVDGSSSRGTEMDGASEDGDVQEEAEKQDPVQQDPVDGNDCNLGVVKVAAHTAETPFAAHQLLRLKSTQNLC
eukprot:s3758_g16.t1